MRLSDKSGVLRTGVIAPFLFVLLALSGIAGCVTEIQKPVAKTALFTTRTGDQAVLSWQSKAGEIYAVRYSESREGGAQWKVLPGCERISGTGEVIEKTDEVPVGTERYYRLIIVPAM